MPRYTARDGRVWDLDDWPGNSFKAIVINAAYASGAFEVVNLFNENKIFFKCFWCGKAVDTAGVEGDHVVTQSAGLVAESHRICLVKPRTH